MDFIDELSRITSLVAYTRAPPAGLTTAGGLATTAATRMSKRAHHNRGLLVQDDRLNGAVHKKFSVKENQRLTILQDPVKMLPLAARIASMNRIQENNAWIYQFDSSFGAFF